VELFGCDFNCEVGASQLALHAFDTCLQVLDCGYKALHFKNLGGAKLDTDVAPLAVLLDNLDFWQFFLHLERLLYFRIKRCDVQLPNPDKQDQCVNEVIFCKKSAENDFYLTKSGKRRAGTLLLRSQKKTE
jgi:hypothetical protein